jgi:hypothetical protein
MLLNLVELLNLTFEHELGSNRDSNVKFAPLASDEHFSSLFPPSPPGRPSEIG